jgi:hypothetical protein
MCLYKYTCKLIKNTSAIYAPRKRFYPSQFVLELSVWRSLGMTGKSAVFPYSI